MLGPGTSGCSGRFGPGSETRRASRYLTRCVGCDILRGRRAMRRLSPIVARAEPVKRSIVTPQCNNPCNTPPIRKKPRCYIVTCARGGSALSRKSEFGYMCDGTMEQNALFEWESCYIGCYIEVERWNTLEALQTPSNAAPPHGASILPSRVRARLFIASNYRLVVFDSL